MTEHVTMLRRQSTRGDGAEPTSRLSLPQDLLEKARGRVKLVALLCFAGPALDSGVGLVEWLASRGTMDELRAALPAISVNLVTMVIALGLFVAARSQRLSHWMVLNLALFFEIVVCLIISVANPWFQYGAEGVLPALTWVTPLIIVFSLIIPTPPLRMLVAALAAAATAPLGLFILAMATAVPIGGGDYAGALFSPAVAAIFAFLGSRVVYGLGLQVSKERRALAREREMGSYRLEELLGRGGMGEVWRAGHRLLARPAAVKLIRPEALGNDEASRQTALRRFQLEAQATSSLQSPHTIELYDFGHTEDQTFYYVMEFLDGLDLDSFVRRFGPVPPERAIHFLTQVCHSLGEAHAKGLIHRDVKPANIYACRLGRDVDFVKVLDFGLVKSARSGTIEDSDLTAEHVAIGTPAYIAPEQALGDRNADARTDIYALGCVAYWLLIGEPVFTGETAMKTMMHHVNTPPAPPSTRSELDIPPALDDVVLACLRKDPDQRPPSADAVSEALCACSIDSRWSEERAQRWWATHLPADGMGAS